MKAKTDDLLLLVAQAKAKSNVLYDLYKDKRSEYESLRSQLEIELESENETTR